MRVSTTTDYKNKYPVNELANIITGAFKSQREHIKTREFAAQRLTAAGQAGAACL